jgi:CubicO group peptidase (beta-lactamase class C family)
MISKRFRKVLTIFTGTLAALVLLISATGYSYLFPAVLHNFPDIDDYKVFSSAHISKSEHPQPWAVSADYNKKKISEELTEKFSRQKTVAFLVIKNDSLKFEEYWDDYDQRSFSNSFSIAKTYVSVLTGIALKEGKIKSLDQPVSDFIEAFRNDDRKHITIRHLLTMSSGLSWEESYSNPLSVTTRGYYGSDLRETCLSLTSIEQPGKQFEYRSGDTQILSFVLEKATGKKLSAYFEEKLWKPTGSENDALWSLDKEKGDEKAYCCLNTNARDFARLGKLYLNMGNWNGKQLVDSHYVKESVTPAPLTDKSTRNPVDFYGYSWWLIPQYKNHNIFYARGILGQYVIVIPDQKIIAVRLGKERGEKIGNHYDDVYMIIDEVLENYGN